MIASPQEIRDGIIMKQLQDHYQESLQLFNEKEIVGIFLQGSQNYKLDYEDSDIDSKLVIVPKLEDICLNKKPISFTHCRDNNEHIDCKDVRLYIEIFSKQNMNFLEILFTDFFIINPMYAEQWNRLRDYREAIARMNPYRAIKAMKGVALEKFYAMEHRYPSKADIVDKYGYDGKQVSHLLRVDDFLERYIAGESYQSCLIPSPDKYERIMNYKMLNRITLEEARQEAKVLLDHTSKMADDFCAQNVEFVDDNMQTLLDDVKYQILKISIQAEFNA